MEISLEQNRNITIVFIHCPGGSSNVVRQRLGNGDWKKQNTHYMKIIRLLTKALRQSLDM